MIPNGMQNQKKLLKKVSEPVYGAIAVFSDCDPLGIC